MRKLLMLVCVVAGFAVPVAAGVAAPGPPLPPVPAPPPRAQMVIRGVLSNFVAPTTTTNGSVEVTVTSLRLPGQRAQKQSPKVKIVLTPQTMILGNVVNGRQGIVKVQRQLRFFGAPLVAVEVVMLGQGTQDQTVPAGGTPVNPDPVDDGTPVCSDEECAAQ